MGETLTTQVPLREPPHVSLMSAEQYLYYWPEIERQLDLVPHIWASWTTKEYLRDIPSHQEMMVFETGLNGAVRAVIFAQFIQSPRGKGLRIVLALGNGLDEWISQFEAVCEQIIHETKCDFGEILGRRGWLRRLEGWKEDYTVMSKQYHNFRVQ